MTDTFRHRGVAVAYDRPGAGNGPSLLFLHNGGTSGTNAKIDRPALAASLSRRG